MNRSIARVAAISAIAATALLATACGSGNSDQDAAKYPAPPSTVTRVADGGGDSDPSSTGSASGRGQETPPTSTGCKKLAKPYDGVDACNPMQVATTALRVMYSPRPVSDRTAADAILRAAPLLSTAMISSVPTTASPAENAGLGEFASLRAARKQVVATVTAQKEGRSTLYRIDRKAIADGAAADSASQPLSTILASVVLKPEPDKGGYRVDSVNIIE